MQQNLNRHKHRQTHKHTNTLIHTIKTHTNLKAAAALFSFICFTRSFQLPIRTSLSPAFKLFTFFSQFDMRRRKIHHTARRQLEKRPPLDLIWSRIYSHVCVNSKVQSFNRSARWKVRRHFSGLLKLLSESQLSRWPHFRRAQVYCEGA